MIKLVYNNEKENICVNLEYQTSVQSSTSWDKYPFWCSDIILATDTKEEFVFVTELYVPKAHRNNGIGTRVLKDLCEEWTNQGKLIIVESGLLKSEYPEEPTDKQFNEVLDRLDKFFINRNFVNINKITNTYEYHELYVYDSEIGRKLISDLKEVYS